MGYDFNRYFAIDGNISWAFLGENQLFYLMVLLIKKLDIRQCLIINFLIDNKGNCTKEKLK